MCADGDAGSRPGTGRGDRAKRGGRGWEIKNVLVSLEQIRESRSRKGRAGGSLWRRTFPRETGYLRTMTADLNDLSAFVAVARAGGFRDAARVTGASASNVSAAVRRLETRLGVRLLNRTTRSVAPTEAGARMLERL